MNQERQLINDAKDALRSIGFADNEIEMFEQSKTFVQQLNHHYAIKKARVELSAEINGFMYQTNSQYGNIYIIDSQNKAARFTTLIHELGHTHYLNLVKKVDWPAAAKLSIQEYHDASIKSEGYAEYNKNLIIHELGGRVTFYEKDKRGQEIEVTVMPDREFSITLSKAEVAATLGKVYENKIVGSLERLPYQYKWDWLRNTGNLPEGREFLYNSDRIEVIREYESRSKKEKHSFDYRNPDWNHLSGSDLYAAVLSADSSQLDMLGKSLAQSEEGQRMLQQGENLLTEYKEQQELERQQELAHSSRAMVRML